MIGFNNLIQPCYFPFVSIEDVDEKKVLVIWVPGGSNRPYKVPEEITAKQKHYSYYIRYNSSSIVEKVNLKKSFWNLPIRFLLMIA